MTRVWQSKGSLRRSGLCSTEHLHCGVPAACPSSQTAFSCESYSITVISAMPDHDCAGMATRRAEWALCSRHTMRGLCHSYRILASWNMDAALINACSTMFTSMLDAMPLSQRAGTQLTKTFGHERHRRADSCSARRTLVEVSVFLSCNTAELVSIPYVFLRRSMEANPNLSLISQS